MAGSEVFERAVAASRLARILAPFTMTRLLVKAGKSPQRLTPSDLEDALPTIREGLAVYLTEDELEAAMESLAAIARG